MLQGFWEDVREQSALLAMSLREREARVREHAERAFARVRATADEVQRHLRPMFAGLARLDAELTDDERAVVERYLTGVLACLDGVIEAPEPAPRG